MARDVPVGFERAQCRGKHLLRDVRYGSAQLAEAYDPAFVNGRQYQHRPFVSETVEYVPYGAKSVITVAKTQFVFCFFFK